MATSDLSDSTLLKVQAASGLVFGGFLSLHLFNAASANLGPAAYNTVQLALRPFYQNRYVEPVVIFGSLIVHTAVSVLRIKRRRDRTATVAAAEVEKRAAEDARAKASAESVFARFSWARLDEPLQLHRYAGYFLAAVVPAHIFAVRIIPLMAGTPASFSNVAFAIAEVSAAVFYPYYVILPAAALYHMMYGGWRAARVLWPDIKPTESFSPRSKAFKAVWGVGLLAFIGTVLVLGGVRYGPLSTEDFPRLRLETEHFTPRFLHGLLPWTRGLAV